MPQSRNLSLNFIIKFHRLCSSRSFCNNSFWWFHFFTNRISFFTAFHFFYTKIERGTVAVLSIYILTNKSMKWNEMKWNQEGKKKHIFLNNDSGITNSQNTINGYGRMHKSNFSAYCIGCNAKEIAFAVLLITIRVLSNCKKLMDPSDMKLFRNITS